MNDLRVRLRASVDSVSPVTLDEVLDRTSASSPHRRPNRIGLRPLLIATAAGLLAVGIIAGHALTNDAHTVTPTQTVTPSPPAPTTADCIVSASNPNGCDVTTDQAQALLGYRVPAPEALPAGWVRLQQAVRIYEPRTVENGSSTEMRMAHSIWGPPGTNLAAPDAQWIRVDVRIALPDELTAGQQPGLLLWTLSDGTRISGFSGPSSFGPPPTADINLVTRGNWIRDGLWYRYESHGRTPDEDRTVIESIH